MKMPRKVAEIMPPITPIPIEFCAAALDLTAAEVVSVATFYSMYRRTPTGEYLVGVCTNTLCAVMGGDEILAELREHLGIAPGETSADGRVTLEHLECNAACDFAPVVMVNWEFFDNQTPESTVRLVDDLRSGAPVAPTRGPSRVCTFKQVSRVLAGFPDGLADEGVGAGTASLRGVQLARREGWTAPDSGDATPDAAPTNDASTEGTATGEQTSVDTPANEPDERPTSDGKEGQA
mgnify:CR=1 FL=1